MPTILHGQGDFVLSNIKKIEVTEEFVGLGQAVTHCQTEEYREDLEERKYRERLLSQCQCVPFTLRSYYGEEVKRSSLLHLIVIPQTKLCSPIDLDCVEKVRVDKDEFLDYCEGMFLNVLFSRFC